MSNKLTRREVLASAAAASTVLATSNLASAAAAPTAPAPATPAPAAPKGPFVLPELPYAPDALAPHISANTLSFHHGKHHKAYVDKANELVAGTDLASKTPEEIVRAVAGDAARTALFNNAAQAWNHSFYWRSMRPSGGGQPPAALAELVKRDFGSVDNLRKQLSEAALAQFGSGWAWLVLSSGKLEVRKTPNAETPLTQGVTPLLTLDVWEHAYYLDFQNRRKDYAAGWLEHLANWDFAAANLAAATPGKPAKPTGK